MRRPQKKLRTSTSFTIDLELLEHVKEDWRKRGFKSQSAYMEDALRAFITKSAKKPLEEKIWDAFNVVSTIASDLGLELKNTGFKNLVEEKLVESKTRYDNLLKTFPQCLTILTRSDLTDQEKRDFPLVQEVKKTLLNSQSYLDYLKKDTQIQQAIKDKIYGTHTEKEVRLQFETAFRKGGEFWVETVFGSYSHMVQYVNDLGDTFIRQNKKTFKKHLLNIRDEEAKLYVKLKGYYDLFRRAVELGEEITQSAP